MSNQQQAARGLLPPGKQHDMAECPLAIACVIEGENDRVRVFPNLACGPATACYFSNL